VVCEKGKKKKGEKRKLQKASRRKTIEPSRTSRGTSEGEKCLKKNRRELQNMKKKES